MKFWDIAYPDVCGPSVHPARFLRVYSGPPDCAPGESSLATAVVLHGGYWKNKYGLDDAFGDAGTLSLAPFFVSRGWSAVAIEYRRRDHVGGGWPGTNEDVVHALEALTSLGRLAWQAKAAEGERASGSPPPAIRQLTTLPAPDADLFQALLSLTPRLTVLLGHSVGGCLALWAAHRRPQIAALVAALAPVADLTLAYKLRVSDEGDAIERYMGFCPDGLAPACGDVATGSPDASVIAACSAEEAEEQYAQASPVSLLPVSFPVIVVYGEKDQDVPPALSEAYYVQASAGAPDLVREMRIAGANHFDIVDAESETWMTKVLPALASMTEAHVSSAAAAALRG